MSSNPQERSLGQRFMGLLVGTPVGDEREQAVVAESSTVGFVVGLYANMAIAFAAAALGSLAVPTILLLISAIPAWATTVYARRQGVDFEDLVARSSPFARIGTLLAVFIGYLLVVAAMAWTVFTGQGIVPMPAIDVGPDSTGIVASMVRGGVIGAMGGLLLGPVFLLLGQRRKRRLQATSASPDDVE